MSAHIFSGEPLSFVEQAWAEASSQAVVASLMSLMRDADIQRKRFLLGFVAKLLVEHAETLSGGTNEHGSDSSSRQQREYQSSLISQLFGSVGEVIDPDAADPNSDPEQSGMEEGEEDCAHCPVAPFCPVLKAKEGMKDG